MGDKLPYDYEEITVGAAAIGLTAGKVAAQEHRNPFAIVHVASAAICYRIDGGTPTSATVNFLESGDVLLLDSIHKMRNFLAIRRDTTDAKLGVTYLR